MIPARVAAVVAAAGFLVIVAFQAALALGAPLGQAAWGGAHRRLPTRLRVGSGVSVVIWLVAALIVLGRAGFAVVSLPSDLERWGSWAVAGLLIVGAVMNAASSSRWERFGWAPVSAILATLTIVVAES